MDMPPAIAAEAEAEAAADSSKSAGGFAPAARRPALIAAILASSMGFIDASVVSLAMPAIRADLSANLADAQWIGNSYLLMLASLVLIGGAAGDVFGVRRIFSTGIAIFMVTSLACALAPDAAWLIGMRGLQGVGAALMVPGSLAIVAKAYPAAERGAAIGTWAAFSSLTTAAGPILGGLLLSGGDPWLWRLIFAINVPAAIVALALLRGRVPDDRPTARRRLDLPGALVATLSLGLIAWGLTSLGIDPAERVAPPLAWIAGGVVAAIVFVAVERRASEPMVRLDLFHSRAFSGANLYTLFLFFGFNGVLFFLPMTLVSAWGAREWEVSLLLMPVSLLIALASGRAGRLADRIGPRLPLTLGAGLVTLSFCGFAIATPTMALWTVALPLSALMGAGMALLVSPLSVAVMMAVPDSDTGLASGVNNAVARASGLMAVAALGSAAGMVHSAMLGGQAPGSEFGAVPIGGADDSLEALRIAATNGAFQAVAALSALACLVATVIGYWTQPSWSKPDRQTD